MASELSDTELRRRLKENDLDAGPITDSTREFYRKKLDQLISGSSKTRRRSAPPKAAAPSAKFQPSLNEYSSEDSEVDSANWGAGSQGSRRNRRRTLPPGPLQVSISRDLLSKPPTSNDSAVFKVPTPVSPGRSSRSRASNISQETPNSYANLTRPKLRSSRRSLQASSPSSYDVDSSDSDLDFERRGYGTGSSHPIPHAKPFGMNSNDEAMSNDNSGLAFRNRHSMPKFAENNLQDRHVGKQNGGHLDDSSFEGEFQVAADVPKSSANYSHLISMFLLGLITIFFVVVGVLYMGVKQDDYISSNSLENFTELICKGFNDVNCIKKEDLPLALKVTRSLHSILTIAAGEYECSLDKRSSRWVSNDFVKLHLQSLYPDQRSESQQQKVLKNALLLIKHHPEWGIRTLVDDDSQVIRAFEATKAHKSLWCRLKLAVQAVFYRIVLVATAILSILGVFIFGKVYKKRKKLHEQQIFELVEDIIDILRDRHEKSNRNENNNTEASVPIIHVRDMLIPPSERKEKQHLWDESVEFLKENESRVLTECKRLAGEEFLAWRWIQQTSPSGTKTSKVWQGQAFGSSGKGVNPLPISPTPCLKIRNMFDPSMEFGENWQVTIQDAILEKCQGNSGIVHMVIDTASEDGCVYMKFSNAEAAGQAYKALHGWWFDGKLLKVKFMYLERYLKRFPESAIRTTPLKPSNNMQLSLQGGYLSSHLESS